MTSIGVDEIELIASQLEHAFDGDPWHGPSLMNVLSGVEAAQAAAYPVAATHSIWELVLHLAAWKKAVLQRLKGQEVELAGAEDWPPVQDSSAVAWKQTLSQIRAAHEALTAEIRKTPPAHLDHTVPNRTHPVRFMLYGAVQHDAYHAGQIAILKKDS